uniref:DBF4-type domain-containing protein n=1 Tax=Elaeophora elaphi TaxID=1147741 RepID=A0A0R3S2A8_9BILA
MLENSELVLEDLTPPNFFFDYYRCSQINVDVFAQLVDLKLVNLPLLQVEVVCFTPPFITASKIKHDVRRRGAINRRYKTISPTVSNAYKTHVDSVNPTSTIHRSRCPAKEGTLSSLDNDISSTARILEGTGIAVPTVSTSSCGSSRQGNAAYVNNISADCGTTSKQTYSCGRFLSLCGNTTSPVARSIIMHEKVTPRKIGTTAPHLSTNMHFNMTMKGSSYSTQIYKDGIPTVNDHIEQKVSSSNGSGNILARYRSYDFKPLHAENNSKRFPMSEQTTFDVTPIIPETVFMDTTNRGYAAKSIVAPFSSRSAGMGQNSFTSFINDEYGTVRTHAGFARQPDSFNYELSMAAILRKTSNEQHNRSGLRSSQEGISGQEYMKRLLQAHQVVDELLKSRGLITEDEMDYWRNWCQKTNREPKIEERIVVDVSDPATSKNAESLDISEASQQRCISNASDSGLSMDADSESDLTGSPKSQRFNPQNFMVTDLLLSKKRETTSVKSVKINIVKTKKHKNVRLEVIIRRSQRYWLHRDVEIRVEKREVASEKTTDSNATRNSRKNFNKGQQIVGDQTEGVKSTNQSQTTVESNEKNFLSQNKRLNQDHKMELPKPSEQFTSTSSRKSSTAKSNEPEKAKKHTIFISKPKCEAVNVCCSFANKLCCPDKATITLSIASCATVKQKNITDSSKKFSDKTKKELKSKCNKGDSDHACLLAKREKLSCKTKMFPESQNMEKSKIRVARKEGKVVESKEKVTKIKKDVVDLNKTEKRSKFPIPIKESAKKLQAQKKGANLVSVSHTKEITPNQARKASTYGKQVTVSKNLCLKSKLSQLEATMIVPMRSHKRKITKIVIVKQMTDSKKYHHEESIRPNNLLVLKKRECPEVKKVQNCTIAATKYYQKTLRSTSRNESNAEFECSACSDIRRVREHLRRTNRSAGRLESSTSFVHTINESSVKLSDKSVTSLGTSSEQSTSVLSMVKKAKKKLSGTKMDKGSKDRPVGSHITTSVEKERCHGGTIVERNSDILDRELINAYRRTQRIPKPQARIPAWNVYDERKLALGTVWNPPKLRHETHPIPCFIRARTPAPVDVVATISTPVPATAVLRHVPVNHLSVMSPRLKSVLSSGSGINIAGSLQQHSPSSQFGVMLKRVDRATVQKSKPRGAITQSAPKKPWVPKWRRIQRTEEEEAEAIPVVSLNKDDNGGDDDEQEKQMNRRLPSQVDTQENGKNMTEAKKAVMVAKRRQIEDETAKLQEYEEKRRVEREREEEELRKLKEKKERRKLEREKEERQFQERFKQEEEKRKQEEEERKAKMEAEKRKKEDEKRKRQQMSSLRFTNTASGQMGRNFVIPQKSDKADKFGNIVQAKHEMSMTKEQQEEAKRNYLVSVKHTTEFEEVAPAELREKIRHLHQRICKLEADKYDLEKRHERQEYDLRELNERQRQVARNKALKKGLDPTDINSRHPPKVSIVSKYDRQIDRRNFRERRAIFENKTAYPCFPNVPPPPTIYEKMVLSFGKGDEPEYEDDEIDEQVRF